MTTINSEIEEELANESINLLRYLINQFGQEEFCVDDLPSFGRDCEYNNKHFKYLRKAGHIIIAQPGVFNINEHSLSI